MNTHTANLYCIITVVYIHHVILTEFLPFTLTLRSFTRYLATVLCWRRAAKWSNPSPNWGRKDRFTDDVNTDNHFSHTFALTYTGTHKHAYNCFLLLPIVAFFYQKLHHCHMAILCCIVCCRNTLLQGGQVLESHHVLTVQQGVQSMRYTCMYVCGIACVLSS